MSSQDWALKKCSMSSFAFRDLRTQVRCWGPSTNCPDSGCTFLHSSSKTSTNNYVHNFMDIVQRVKHISPYSFLKMQHNTTYGHLQCFWKSTLFRRKILKFPSHSVTIIAQLVSSATSFRIERQVLPSIRPRYLHRLRYKFLSPGQTPRHHLLRM